MIKSRTMRLAGHAAPMGKKGNACTILVRKTEGKRQLERTSRIFYNIKIGFREIGWGVMDWIDLAQDRDK
jgi:hypothetical protein